MRKHHVTQILTLAVLAAALGMGLARKAGWRLADLTAAPITGEVDGQDPASTIYSMLNAARAGDVNGYLAGYTGEMAATLRQTLAETTESDFAKYLRDSNSTIKGVALSEPRATGGTATVRVEYVYQDRNESQLMYLEQGPKGWKIFRADSDERIKTLIPYGTPIK